MFYGGRHDNKDNSFWQLKIDCSNHYVSKNNQDIFKINKKGQSDYYRAPVNSLQGPNNENAC